MRWSLELSEFNIKFEATKALKAQVLVNYVVEMTSSTGDEKTTTWTIFVVGSSNSKGNGAGDYHWERRWPHHRSLRRFIFHTNYKCHTSFTLSQIFNTRFKTNHELLTSIMLLYKLVPREPKLLGATNNIKLPRACYFPSQKTSICSKLSLFTPKVNARCPKPNKHAQSSNGPKLLSLHPQYMKGCS